jgi:DNA gyrase subunit A
MAYAMSTILNRALPDIRDGLKPVHRRVLYAMHALNLSPDASFRKSARIVGEVLGKFHPHGDQSVYDALVRMAQDFVMAHPLITGHGNFGSVDADPAAAMRYTEAKLSPLAYEALLADLWDGTVDFVPNFDGNEEEPVVFPARAPILLLNGASGIAVGMATNIPPHNLGELLTAVEALISDPRIDDALLLKIVPGPDFPSGGFIINNSTMTSKAVRKRKSPEGLSEGEGAEDDPAGSLRRGLRELYMEGRGSVLLRAKTHFEGGATAEENASFLASGRNANARKAIVVTELPYLTVKSDVIAKIADLVNDKKLEGISDIRDESDRDGIRIVIELKRDADPSIVLNNLFAKTTLQSRFSGNMVALTDGGRKPERFTLRKALQSFIEFRFETVKKRTEHYLKKQSDRLHILEGVALALTRVDDVVKLIKESKDSAAVKMRLASDEFGLTTAQADAVLALRLSRLTSMEVSKLLEEANEARSDVLRLQDILHDDSKIFDLIRKETQELKAKFAIPRRSVIIDDVPALSKENLIPNARSVIVVTSGGYIKRMPLSEFESQRRGTRGKRGTSLASHFSGSDEIDTVSNLFSCNDHDSVIFVTNKGKAYKVQAHDIPQSSRTARGTPIPQVIRLQEDEVVSSVAPLPSVSKTENSAVEQAHGAIVSLTWQGAIKKTPISEFSTMTTRGLKMMRLRDGDTLKWARLLHPGEDVVIATRLGFATRFSESQLAETKRSSGGVRAMKLREGDEIIDMDVVSQIGDGSGSMIHSSLALVAAELNASQNALGPSAPSVDSLIASPPPSSRSLKYVLAVTSHGFGKRLLVSDIPKHHRNTKGSHIIKFSDSSKRASDEEAPPTPIEAKRRGHDKKSLLKKREDDSLKCLRVCKESDHFVVSTAKGVVAHQQVSNVGIRRRAARGFLIQSLRDDDSVAMVDIVPAAAVPQESTDQPEAAGSIA